MKQRLITAIIIFAIAIPLIMIGGTILHLGIMLLGIFSLRELLNVRDKQIPTYIKIMAYALVAFMILFDNALIYQTALILLLIPIIFVSKNKYHIEDAFYVIAGTFLIGKAYLLMMLVRNDSIELLLFLFLVTIITDTYAYLGGMLIGKHKLLPDISPKKTIEGLVVGTIFGSLISGTYYYIFVNDSISLISLMILAVLLSLVGQLGDLIFSAIKRHYKVKDFSNLMPGHGGLCDRFDSIIFVILVFSLIKDYL